MERGHQKKFLLRQQVNHTSHISGFLDSRCPAGPSMFGRDLAEQIKSDSKEEIRTVPVIVEKCISAVDALGAYPRSLTCAVV